MNLDERIDQATEVFKPSLAERNALRDDIKGVIRDVLEYVEPERKDCELYMPMGQNCDCGQPWRHEMEAKTKELGL